MTILSFDVGIRNLAGCIMEKDEEGYKIHWWNVINLLQEEERTCCGIRKFKNGNTKECKKKPCFFYRDKAYCQLHLDEVKVNFIKNEDKTLVCDTCEKKAKWRHEGLIVGEKYCTPHYKQNTKVKKIPVKNCNNIRIDEIIYNIWTMLDDLPHLLEVTAVVIENQPAKKNRTMKAVADSLFNYFMSRGIIDKERTKSSIIKVSYISASNKLKIHEEHTNEVLAGKKKKERYKYTKKLGIEYCSDLIKNDLPNADYFKNSKKKDDLADCFLQGVYYLNKQSSNATYSSGGDGGEAAS
jgi:hypothetical protein